MTFLQLQQLVSYYLDDLNFGYFTQTQVKLWLNLAQKEVQKRLIKAGQNYYLRCSQTTLVVNQQEYELPTDFKKEHRLELIISGTAPNESKQILLPITLNQQDLIQQGPGESRFYTFKRNRLVIYPAPLTAYVMKLYYSYAVADMVNDSDTPDVPEQYHELIALIAAEDGFIKDGRASDLLNKRMSDFQKQMDSDAQERNQDMPRTVVETGNDSYSGYVW